MNWIVTASLIVLGLFVMCTRHDTHSEIAGAPVPPILAPSTAQENKLNSLPGQTPRPNHPLLASAEAETDPDRRSEALERAVESVSDTALPGVLDSLAAFVNPVAVELRELLVRRWAENDAPAAAAWAEEIPGGSARRTALEQIAIAWANKDLANALAWLLTLSEGESKRAAMLGVAYEAARSEPLIAVELARELPNTRERDELVIHAVSQWAATDFAAATEWSGKIADRDLRIQALASVAVASAEQNAAGSATLVANALEAGETQSRAAVAVVQRWTQSSPREAATWVAQFPDTPSREAAVQNLVTIWTAQSSEDAANWLTEIPEGPVRDVGLSAYTKALTPTIVTESEE